MANGALADKVLGGWSVSGVYVAASGLPDMVYDSAACFSEFGSTPSNGNSNGMIPIGPGTFNQTRVNNPTLSTSGYGSGSTGGDRKSTRLNSSHGYISYAVFCLKKKH